MKQISDKLKGHEGRNPFTAIQARDVAAIDLVHQFQVNQFYLSRFNDNNEIIFGSRGSGKTILLRMMSYSLYRKRKDDFSFSASGHYYFGVYIPLRLGLMKEISAKPGASSEKQEYFSFCVNCIAAASFLREAKALLEDYIPDSVDRLLLERELVNQCCELWSINLTQGNLKIGSLILKIDHIYQSTPAWIDGKGASGPFEHTPLYPLLRIADWLTERINLDPDHVTWIANFDEAEFLDEEFQKVINVLMRSEKRPFAVKIATLPFRWKTYETSSERESVQPNNGDVTPIEMKNQWDSEDYQELSNGIIANRLKTTGLFDNDDITIDRFLSENANMSLIDRFRLQFPNISPEQLNKAVVDSFGERRKKTFESSNKDLQGYTLKRFKPLYITRQLHKKSRKGNSVPVLLTGGEMVRRLSEGNPRVLLQIFDRLFEAGTKRTLALREQHRELMEYCVRADQFSKFTPYVGQRISDLIEKISSHLHDNFYKDPLTDVGIKFVLGTAFSTPETVTAIEEAIAHSYIFCEDDSVRSGITSSSIFRLSYITAARKWLPMRLGQGITVGQLISQDITNESPSDVVNTVNFLQSGNTEGSSKELKQTFLDIDEN
jgi:hypothetical protein